GARGILFAMVGAVGTLPLRRGRRLRDVDVDPAAFRILSSVHPDLVWHRADAEPRSKPDPGDRDRLSLSDFRVEAAFGMASRRRILAEIRLFMRLHLFDGHLVQRYAANSAGAGTPVPETNYPDRAPGDLGPSGRRSRPSDQEPFDHHPGQRGHPRLSAKAA